MIDVPAATRQRQAWSPHRRFTEAEIEAANDVDLPDLMSHMGYHAVRL